MSHITKKKAKISNLSDLQEACDQIGMEFKEGQTTCRYYAGRKEPCTHAIVVPGNTDAYELGVLQEEDGTFSLLFDSYGGGNGLIDKIGRNADRLMQEVSVAMSIRHMRMKGRTVSRVQNGKNVVVLAT